MKLKNVTIGLVLSAAMSFTSCRPPSPPVLPTVVEVIALPYEDNWPYLLHLCSRRGPPTVSIPFNLAPEEVRRVEDVLPVAIARFVYKMKRNNRFDVKAYYVQLVGFEFEGEDFVHANFVSRDSLNNIETPLATALRGYIDYCDGNIVNWSAQLRMQGWQWVRLERG